MAFTEYLDKSLELLLFSDTAWTPPANYYVGLSSTTPTQNDGGNEWGVTEPSGGGYSRVEVANTTSNWATSGSLTVASSTGGWTIQNVNAVTFAQSSAAWLSSATLTYFFLADGSGALAPGTVNVLLFGALNPTQVVSGSGTTLSFGAGQLTAGLD